MAIWGKLMFCSQLCTVHWPHQPVRLVFYVHSGSHYLYKLPLHQIPFQCFHICHINVLCPFAWLYNVVIYCITFWKQALLYDIVSASCFLCLFLSDNSKVHMITVYHKGKAMSLHTNVSVVWTQKVSVIRLVFPTLYIHDIRFLYMYMITRFQSQFLLFPFVKIWSY